jgi:hypothetical protein
VAGFRFRLLALRDRFLELTSPDEWSELTKYRAPVLEALGASGLD